MCACQYDRLKINDKAVKIYSKKTEKVPFGEGQGTRVFGSLIPEKAV